MGIELVGTSDVEELRDSHDRGERSRLELLEQLVFAVCFFGCSWPARKPHHDVIAAVDTAAPHRVFRSRGIEVFQSEVGPLGTLGGQQRANDPFARVGFVIVDLVDHRPIVVHNAAGRRCQFSVPAQRSALPIGAYRPRRYGRYVSSSAPTGVSALAGVLSDVLGDRLETVVVYGSGATGDILDGYSDLDVLVLTNAAVDSDDAMRLHDLVRDLDFSGFAYVQPSFARADEASPLLVEGSFQVIFGAAPPPTAFQTETDLRTNGEQWLNELPGLVRRDLADWSLAAIDVHRRARLAITRLKPAVRAVLVRHGAPPVETWAASWDDLVAGLADIDGELARQVGDVLVAIRSGGHAHTVGTVASNALLRVCALVSDARESAPLTIVE